MKTINKPVYVTGFRFKKNQEIYPTRAEIDGKTICFTENALTCHVRSGGQKSRILTLTDGLEQFRLRCDDREGVWTLLSIGA